MALLKRSRRPWDPSKAAHAHAVRNPRFGCLTAAVFLGVSPGMARGAGKGCGCLDLPMEAEPEVTGTVSVPSEAGGNM